MVVLQDFLNLASEMPPPAWVESFHLSSEESFRARIGSLEEERRQLDVKIQEASAELQAYRGHTRLLYENGYALEETVWKALERLGAKVHPSDVPGREDRWFEAPDGRRAALEVKGSQRGMALEDARQADHWTSDLMARLGKPVKRVLLGNPFRNQPPDQRPMPWPPNMAGFAKERRLTLMTTVQLFDVLVRVEQGAMKPEQFFDLIFRIDGPVTL